MVIPCTDRADSDLQEEERKRVKKKRKKNFPEISVSVNEGEKYLNFLFPLFLRMESPISDAR